MLELTDFSVKIRILLEPGMYECVRESATGKTYLCNLLKKHREDGKPVVGFTFSDYKAGFKINSDEMANLKLLFLDRYDLYNGAFADELIELAKHAIVLIDCKEGAKIPHIHSICSVDYVSPTEIVIY